MRAAALKYIRTMVFLLFIVHTAIGQNTDVRQKIKYHTEKVQNYLDKEKALSAFYSIDDRGIRMYAGSADKSKDKAEFELKWDQLTYFCEICHTQAPGVLLEKYKNGTIPVQIFDKVYFAPSGELPLRGKKISIDPGHIAFDHVTGDLEKKHIKIKGDSLNGIKDSVEVSEGILTFATAELLKEKLGKQGATVMLTRDADKTSFGKTFEQWKKDDLKNAVDSLYKVGELNAGQKTYFLSGKAKDRDIFRVIFRDLELAKRVELINNFHPDITVVIHYNVDESNVEWQKCSQKNFNMAFVAGSFMKNDLSTKEKRFEFLRLLVTDDLEKSIALSSAVVRNFEKNLDVKTAGIHDAKYLAEGCMSTGTSGVYCRNLQLPRYIHSPVVYGETLYQDNISECKLLNEEVDKKKNKRIQQVADAYYRGITEYYQK